MKDRNYKGVQLSKKESELITFLQTGSNFWMEAFFIYKQRRYNLNRDVKSIRSWFNSTLSKLKRKGLMSHIPFVIEGIGWMNPGVEASKANLVIEQKHQHTHELKVQKPIL